MQVFLTVILIESQRREMSVLQKAGVTGYDYIEKMIQLPFCIPDLTTHKKVCFMEHLSLKKYIKNPSLLYEGMEGVYSEIPPNIEYLVFLLVMIAL